MKLIDLSLRRLLLSIVPLALFAMANVEASQSAVQVIGEAFELNGTEVLYRETHCGVEDKPANEVVYQHRDGLLIARKSLDYSSGNISPSFVQHNIQADERISVSLVQNELAMSVTGAGSKTRENKYRVAAAADNPIVIDAGFDAFIRSNWDKLESGKTLGFQFPLVSRSRLVSLWVKPATCSYDTASDQCFKLEPTNWFFRLLAAPIELGYDSNEMRLTRYRGLSNINDENGNGMVVDIRYRYNNTPGLACDITPVSSTGPAVNLNLLLDPYLS
ncbi:MAG: hypothetical protein ACI9KN_002413 [Gammaproteobacteria bacterium]|jgi:hypothetical protein